MSYFNKKPKNSNLPIKLFGIAVGIFLVWLIAHNIVRKFGPELPVITGESIYNTLSSKKSLVSKITELQTTIESNNTKILENNLLTDENNKLKAELGRTPKPAGVLAHVVTIPSHSFYDTFTIDAGSVQGLSVGQIAYAFDSIALGTITDITENSSTVQLFSKSGRETSASTVGSDVTVTLIGRGGGEYEVRMPRDVKFEVGGLLSYQSVHSSILAQIERITTDPRDPFQRLLAKAPLNLQTLKWVIVR